MTTPPIDLDALYDRALEARERIEASQAAEAARRHSDLLRQARKMATADAARLLELEIPPAAWEELDTDYATEAITYPLGERDGHPLRLAFRHRGITEGGDVLTVLALAPVEEVWVGARYPLTGLYALPSVIDDAIAMADTYDEASAAEEAGPQDDTPRRPPVRIEGDTLEAVLSRAIIELVRPMIPTDD